jgi:hypothetical protein
VETVESSQSCDDGNNALSDVIADGAGANGAPDGDGGGIPPVTDIHFNHGWDEGKKKNKEVTAATIADVNVAVADVNQDEDLSALMACPYQMLLPIFIDGQLSNAAASAVLSLASWGGGSQKCSRTTNEESDFIDQL